MYSNMSIKDILHWGLEAKISFFDIGDFSSFDSMTDDQIHSILESLINSKEENLYVKKQSIQLYIDLSLGGIIKKNRRLISLLLDDVSLIYDHLIQLSLLKNLWLFYEKESDEIEQFYREYTNEEQELMSEKYMALGYVYAYKVAKSSAESDFIKQISLMRENFNLAKNSIENRIDADFFILFSDIWMSLNGNSPKIQSEDLLDILREYRFNTQLTNEFFFQYSIYKILLNTEHLTYGKPTEWIDYKKEFEKIYSNWVEIKNSEIKNGLLKNNILSAIKDSVQNKYIEPYIRINFLAEKIKIEQCICTIDIDNDLKRFLIYILEIIPNYESVNILTLKSEVIKCLPNISSKEIDQMNSIEDVIELSHKYISSTERLSFNYINTQLIASLIELQNNAIYFNSTEDQRNTFIRSLLGRTLNVRDQTFSGASATGQNAGEVDILILNYNNMHHCYIEAMNLCSVNKSYIRDHVSKIYGYDRSGCENNYIISYVKIKNFEEFWSKYYSYISKIELGMPLTSQDEIMSGYSNIKICKLMYMRNGQITNLYHIAVLINQK